MIISYSTAYSNLQLNNGFGMAGFSIINALKELGHTVYFQAPTAPVQFTFAQPEYFRPTRGQYQIILCPWESTELHEGWVDAFNSADETWATSEWVAEQYIRAGVTNLTTVFPHGISKKYKPKLKKRNGPVKYIHVGGPANRKGAQEAFDAFREAFGDDPKKATLTIKAYQRSLVRWFDESGRVRNPADLPNVTINLKEMEREELVDFQAGFDVAIYPSAGEGWGFIPVEFLAQGTPTICTGAWAEYSDYLGDLAVKSKLVDSPWPMEHPGKVYKVDHNDLVKKILLSYNDFENQSAKAFKNSFKLHKQYDWVTLTEQAFAPLVERFG